MREDEIFNPNEYNNTSEINNVSHDIFLTKENVNFNENITLNEENNIKTNNEIKNTQVKTFKFKDRIIESTSPLRTIVSAATCTATAAIATTTVFLTPSPKVTNVNLVCGNDYVEYFLNIDSLDLESSYLLKVSNGNFSYSEDLDLSKANSLNYIDGYVNGLKPNNKYKFSLLRSNGEIGGYSDYYSKDFYTLKAPTPNVLFDFSLDDNVLNYNIFISDTNDICENTYLTYTIYGSESDRIDINGNNYDSSITLIDKSSIKFDVYSTLYGEEILLSSYKYDFTNFNSYIDNNYLYINGRIGNDYNFLTNAVIDVLSFDENDEILNSYHQELKKLDNVDLQYEMNNVCAYSFTVSHKDVILFDSGKLIYNAIPERNILSQTIEDNYLILQMTNVSQKNYATIMDESGVEIECEVGEGFVKIPLLNTNGEQYVYSVFDIYIDGIEYIIEPDDKLLYVDNSSMYVVDNQLILKTSDFITMNNSYDKLIGEVKLNDNIIKTLTIDSVNNTFNLGNEMDGYESLTIDYYLVDKNGDKISNIYKQDNITTVDRISLDMSCSDNELNMFIVSSNNCSIVLNYYDMNNNKLEDQKLDITYTENEAIYNYSLTNNYSGISYKVYDGTLLLYESKMYKFINISDSISQDVNSKYIILEMNNIDTSMSGSIKDAQGNDIPLIFENNKMLIPLIDEQYNKISYTTYTVTLYNDFDRKTVNIDVKDQLKLQNVRLNNSYSGNYLAFDDYIVTLTASYTMVVEAYVQEQLLMSDTIENENIYNSITTLFNINTQLGNNADVTFKIYIKDDNGEIIDKVYEFTMLGKDMSIGDFHLNSINPSEVLVTYNDDGTINMYFAIDFSCDDNDVYCAIILNEEERIVTQDKIVALENYENKQYGVTYQVFKESQDLLMVFEETTPSGMINENTIPIDTSAIKEEENGSYYVTVDVSSIETYDSTTTYFENHPNAVFDEQTSTWKVEIDNDDTEIIMHLYMTDSEFENNLSRLTNIDQSFTYQGDSKYECVYTITIEN